MASELELNDFLKSVEKRAFKRMLYQVRDTEAALDIVQDSMMKLCSSYSDKPLTELPLLFQRILSNTMLDWFRRQKTKKSFLLNFSDFNKNAHEDEDFDVLEVLEGLGALEHSQNGTEQDLSQKQTLVIIGKELEKLSPRQRQAFLLRYWEEMDVNETAEIMQCTAGSVKTHCSRAVATLAQALQALGIRP